MKNSRRIVLTWLPLLTFVILAFFLWRGLQLDPRKLPNALINQPVPTFALEILEPAVTAQPIEPSLHSNTEKSATLSSPSVFTQKNFLGHISILNIWASWCITCSVEHPFLLELAKTSELPIYGLDYKDSTEAAHSWLKILGNPYQKVFSDPDGKVAIDFGVYGTPESFLIGKDGRIRYKHVGDLNPRVWQDEFLPRIKILQHAQQNAP